MTKYYTNVFPIINIFKKPSKKSEIVTQMIYGESFSISKKTKKWFKIKIKEDKTEDFEKIFKNLSEDVRSNEEGNIFYQVAKDRENENTYLVLEHYKDQESVDAHGKSDHFRSAGRAIGECLDGPPVIKYLDALK